MLLYTYLLHTVFACTLITPSDSPCNLHIQLKTVTNKNVNAAPASIHWSMNLGRLELTTPNSNVYPI